VSETVGKLDLTFRRKADGKTYLAKQYYQLPLQILPPHYQDADGTAFLYLLNPSGGVLQNDRLYTEILVEENSRVCITTPSANKFYKMEDGCAKIENRFHVGRNAVLEYLPEHNVPFTASKVYQESTYYLDRESTLIAFDVVTSGRTERGERFAYDIYSSKTKIYVAQKLIAFENGRIEPGNKEHGGIGLFEGYDIYGTVFFYKENLSELLADELRSALERCPGIHAGVSQLNPSLLSVKFLGKSVPETQKALSEIWSAGRRSLLSKDRVRIRKY
jgi:urease accessory protein